MGQRFTVRRQHYADTDTHPDTDTDTESHPDTDSNLIIPDLGRRSELQLGYRGEIPSERQFLQGRQ